MVQHVLAVARAELEAPHEPEDLGMQIVQAQLERDGGAFLAHGLVGLFLDLLHDLLDARGWMRPSAMSRSIDSLAISRR